MAFNKDLSHPLLQTLPVQAPRAPGNLQGFSAQGPETEEARRAAGAKGPKNLVARGTHTRAGAWSTVRGLLGDPAGTVVPRSCWKRCLVFCVEDATPWNYSILALAAVVVMISMFLGRSIQANRKQKMQPPEKENPEVLHLDEARTKDHNSLNNLRGLCSQKSQIGPGGT
ncbi:hypothetical protein H8959_015568 [Pygathrix nigripes]